MTKHESNSDCYDTATAEECSTIVENECYKNQKACKKVIRIDHVQTVSPFDCQTAELWTL